MTSISEVKQIALSNYGITVEAKKLPGYEDENYKLSTLSGDSFILKIYRAEESAAFLKFQNAALQHLESKKLTIHLPKVIPNSGGNLLNSIPSENQKRVVRLLSWVEGRLCLPLTVLTSSTSTSPSFSTSGSSLRITSESLCAKRRSVFVAKTTARSFESGKLSWKRRQPSQVEAAPQ